MDDIFRGPYLIILLSRSAPMEPPSPRPANRLFGNTALYRNLDRSKVGPRRFFLTASSM